MTQIWAWALAGLLGVESAVLEIRVVEGEGAVEAAGARGAAFTVEVTDGVGKPVTGAVVSVRLPDDGPSGVFANGLVSDIAVTGADGRATTSQIRWNRLPGTVQVRITVVKDRLRAGAVSTRRTVEGGLPPAPAGPVLRPSRRHSKWLKIGLIAGAAGAGFGIGMAMRGGGGNGQVAAASTSTITIGAPSISITNP